MLTQPYRLRSSRDIARVYKKGSYGGGNGVLSVKALLSGHRDSRVVVVVSKKIDKRAVVRNRLRRRLSGDLEAHWATLKAGYDIVVSVHSDVSDLSAAKLHEHLSQALKRSGVAKT